MTSQEKVAKLLATVPKLRTAAAMPTAAESSKDSNIPQNRPATRRPATTVDSGTAQSEGFNYASDR